MFMKNKNNMIEMSRFLACYVIFSYHAKGIFCSGWIFVEYFFMLSGYFAVSHLVRMKGKIGDTAKYPLQYVCNKFRRLFPYTTAGFILGGIAVAWKYDLHGMEIIKWLLYLPVNILFLPGTGGMPAGIKISDQLSTTYIMGGALWYICAMFVALPIMLYLLIYAGKKLGPWLISFLPMLLYGYLIICDGTIDGWHAQHMAFFALDMRALAGLLLGGLIYVISAKIKKCNYTKTGTAVLTIIELGSFLLVVVFACTVELPYDILEILCFMISLSLTLSGKTFTSKINLKFIVFLGKISLPVYCVHEAVLTFLKDMDCMMWEQMVFVIVLLCSVFLYLIIEKSRSWFTSIAEKIRGVLVL